LRVGIEKARKTRWKPQKSCFLSGGSRMLFVKKRNGQVCGWWGERREVKRLGQATGGILPNGVALVERR
jgi:hypothetical protein